MWLIAAVQYADREMQVVKAYFVGEAASVADIATGGVRQAVLKSTHEVAALIHKGDNVFAIWTKEDGGLLAQLVGIVPMPGGAEALEAISQGAPADRKLRELPDVDRYYFEGSRVPDASVGQLQSSVLWLKSYVQTLDGALKILKRDVKKPQRMH